MKQKAKVSESSQLLVATGKSSRLDAIRKKTGLLVDKVDLDKSQPLLISGLNQQTKETLQQANSIIDERMNQILDTYSAGKKNTFFKIKYGVVPGKVRDKGIKEIFKLLALDAKTIKHFHLIESLHLDGTSSNA